MNDKRAQERADETLLGIAMLLMALACLLLSDLR